MRHAVAALFLVAASLAQAAPPLEFKGIVLGQSTRADVIAKFPGSGGGAVSNHISATIGRDVVARCGKRPTSKCLLEPSNVGLYTIGPSGIGDFDFMLMGKTVELITAKFPAQGYDTILGALREKYGAPTTMSVNTKQNRFGATFRTHFAMWRFYDGSITLDEYSDADSLLLAFVSAKWDASHQPPPSDPKANAKQL